MVVGLSPYFHAFGGLLMLMSLVAGTPMVAIGKFSMVGLLDCVEKHQVTVRLCQRVAARLVAAEVDLGA